MSLSHRESVAGCLCESAVKGSFQRRALLFFSLSTVTSVKKASNKERMAKRDGKIDIRIVKRRGRQGMWLLSLANTSPND